MRHYPGLALGSLRKPIAKALSYPFMKLLPPAPEERCIGGILHKRVLERIAGFGRRPVAEDQARGDQLSERILERDALSWRDRFEKVIGEFAADRCANLCDPLMGAKRSSLAINESWRVDGIASGVSAEARAYDPSCSRRSPDSSTVLATISSKTSAGNALPPATRSIMAMAWRRPKRLNTNEWT